MQYEKVDPGTKTANVIPEFTLDEMKLTGEHMTTEQLMQLKYDEFESGRAANSRTDFGDCLIAQAASMAGAGGGLNCSSQGGDSESLQGGNGFKDTSSQYYRAQMQEMRDHINHLETLKSKLVPDLERYEAEIYDLKIKVKEQETELKAKDRECYSYQNQLSEAKQQLAIQLKIIEEAGAQQAMQEAMLKAQKTGQKTTAESHEQDQTIGMFHDI